MRPSLPLPLGVITLALGCTGALDAGGSSGRGASELANLVPEVAARRLGREEVGAAVLDLVGVRLSSTELAVLPEDSRRGLFDPLATPFDVDYTQQAPDRTLIEGASSLAASVVQTLTSTGALPALVPCTPVGRRDDRCMERFVTRFGRRALRRPLDPSEVTEFVALGSFGEETGDFYEAVGMVIEVLLQDPEFLYRLEDGRTDLAPRTAEVGAVVSLDDFEVATRLSMLLWGSVPDDDLLDLAERGGLSSETDVRRVVGEMMADPRALGQIENLHAMWLGYADTSVPAEFAASMGAETHALIERVVFDEHRPWRELFTLPETYVDRALGEHYGLDTSSLASGSSGWLPYGDAPRAGILSHGRFLSVGARFGETSPTQRGIAVRTRLLCGVMTRPPAALGVNTDAPPSDPGGSPCRQSRYRAHQATACVGCHRQMDDIGFGLERFGMDGAYREVETENPECAIDGEGAVVSGTEALAFSGPAELADVLVESGTLESCFARQMFRYTFSRHELEEEDPLVRFLERRLRRGRFDEFLATLATLPGFRARRAAL